MTDKDLADKLSLYRINPEEYKKICDLLGREPEDLEWCLFSALWSEHCSYKSSKVHLKNLFSESDRVLQSFGENAGIVDLGGGERVAFKMESHNHPSFIEPYQGAATGVGGILRDIFTMGARPIALANYLCFGDPKAARMSTLVNGVVRGIGGYGNCVGVPNITGQTNFDPKYNKNILVNALAVGLFEEGDPIALSGAKGVGNLVVYVGAKTGRDGVHGASMASASFGEDSQSQLPTVQIGDPFYEKLLIESCLEVIQAGLVVAIQDMGAAGITSSCFEMAEKGGVGFDMHLDKVPLRDASMTPEDILLSESQERMILICEPEKLEAIQKVFHRWGLDSCEVGKVIEKPVIRLNWHGDLRTEISPELIVGNAPQYQRPFTVWEKKTSAPAELKRPEGSWPTQLKAALASVDGGSKEWVYNQYDQRVGAKTARDCSQTTGVLRLPSGRGMGLVLGCRPHVMEFDAYIGGADSVFYPALELASKGFEALAVTDCLNYANPEKNEIMSEFVASLDGMNRACEALKAPIISGNVSFYNETGGQGIISTPSTGLVGLKDSLENIPSTGFQNEGDAILLLRWSDSMMTGLLAKREGDSISGFMNDDFYDLGLFTKAVRDLVNEKVITSSRLVGNYGLAYTLARMTLSRGLGAKIESGETHLFDEPLYSVVITAAQETAAAILKDWAGPGTATKLGTVSGDQLEIQGHAEPVAALKESYEKSWSDAFPQLS